MFGEPVLWADIHLSNRDIFLALPMGAQWRPISRVGLSIGDPLEAAGSCLQVLLQVRTDTSPNGFYGPHTSSTSPPGTRDHVGMAEGRPKLAAPGCGWFWLEEMTLTSGVIATHEAKEFSVDANLREVAPNHCNSWLTSSQEDSSRTTLPATI